MKDQPLIYLNNVSVYRDKILVVSKLSLQMDSGEFVYLIGKTGSGKSSLLKTLYAELRVEAGEAAIAGYNLSQIKQKEVPFLRRKLGIVFQDFQLLFDRTVNENLEFVMKATGWKKREAIEKRLQEALEMVGMPVKGFKMPYELSGGEQQRVCIARALINDPGIILADEPTGNLDPETSAEIVSLLHKINRDGTTVLLATHNHQMIDKFPARLVQLDKGTVINDH